MKYMKISLCMMTATLLLSGCVVPFSIDPAYLQTPPFPPAYLKAVASRTPQVVYRLDAQRYVTLENYSRCRAGALYYNDTAKGIRTQVEKNGGVAYEGKIINSDPSGNNLVIPSHAAYCEKSCPAYLPYSTDGGRSFKFYRYTENINGQNSSKDYMMAATKDQIMVDVVNYPRGRADYGDLPNVASYRLTLPSTVWTHSGSRSLIDLPLPPSGEDRYTCDDKSLPKFPDY